MIRKEDVFKIGRLGRPHALEGEIVFTFTNDIFDRTEAPYWVMEMDGIPVPFFLESYRFRSDTTALVKFLDLDDAEAVRMLSDHDVFFPKAYAPEEELADCALTWGYFEGFEVRLAADGRLLGTVTAVDESTLNTLFEITPDSASGSGSGSGSDFGGGSGSAAPEPIVVPANEDFIVRIDEKGHCLYMSFPEGLLEI